jgi:hypothetical protein
MNVKSIIVALIKVGCDYALKRLATNDHKSLNTSKKRNSDIADSESFKSVSKTQEDKDKTDLSVE